MTIKQDKISEDRDKETNMLHNKLSKGGTLEINHHVKEKNIEKELNHILVNLKKKLEIEKISKFNLRIRDWAQSLIPYNY